MSSLVQACTPGALLRPVTQAGLLIGSAVTTGVAIAEFGQRFPEPGTELLAQILLALKRDLIRSIPCQILDTLGDLAGHIGNWDSASGLYQAALLCSFVSPGTGPKGRNSLMMTGSGGGSRISSNLYDELAPRLGNMSKEEFNRLASLWDKGSFDTLGASLIRHANKHANDDLAALLRRASNFNFRGARTRYRKEDGSSISTKGNGEFIITRDGKIVSYGNNNK